MKHFIGSMAICLTATVAASGLTLDVVATVDGDITRNATSFIVDTTSEGIQTLRSGPNNVVNGVYEFDLSGLPSGATITGATLKLTTRGLVSNTGPTADITFSAFPGDGVIDDTDHQNNTAGTLVGDETYGTGGSGPSIGTALDIVFDSVVPIQAAYDALGSDFVTVRSETVNFVNFFVHSIDTTNSSVVLPTLSIEYIPEPASLALLGLGTLLLRRR